MCLCTRLQCAYCALVVKLCTYNVPSVPNMYLMYLICAWCTCLFLGVHFRYHTLVLENSQSYCSLQVHYRYAIYPPPPTLKSHIIRKPAFSTFENSSRLRSVIQKTVSSQQLISTMFYFYHIEPTILKKNVFETIFVAIQPGLYQTWSEPLSPAVLISHFELLK